MVKRYGIVFSNTHSKSLFIELRKGESEEEVRALIEKMDGSKDTQIEYIFEATDPFMWDADVINTTRFHYTGEINLGETVIWSRANQRFAINDINSSKNTVRLEDEELINDVPMSELYYRSTYSNQLTTL